jgi:hypothetical protein
MESPIFSKGDTLNNSLTKRIVADFQRNELNPLGYSGTKCSSASLNS